LAAAPGNKPDPRIERGPTGPLSCSWNRYGTGATKTPGKPVSLAASASPLTPPARNYRGSQPRFSVQRTAWLLRLLPMMRP